MMRRAIATALFCGSAVSPFAQTDSTRSGVAAAGLSPSTPTVSNLTITSPGFLNDGFRFVVVGPVGHTCVVQRSSDLIEWTSVSTNALMDGKTEFKDSNILNSRPRFYRAKDLCWEEPPRSITLVTEDAGKTVQVGNGSTIDVVLAGNPSTGFTWEVAAMDAAILKQIGEPTFKPDRPVPGSPGKVTLRFQAIGPGQTTLKLIYHRPFEANLPPANSFEILLVVH